ncbi:MAG: DnaA N-terminal domain-containing protein [Pseudomonadota bacterium]
MPYWDFVGPDFAARMVDAPEPPGESNVVPLHTTEVQLPEPDTHGWSQAALRLSNHDPAIYNVWFAPLRVLDLDAGVLNLSAPSKFHAAYVRTHLSARLLAALVSVNPGVREVCVHCRE